MYTHIIRFSVSIALIVFLFVAQIGEMHAYQTPGDVFGIPDDGSSTTPSPGSGLVDDGLIIPSLVPEGGGSADVPTVTSTQPHDTDIPAGHSSPPPPTGVYSTNNRKLVPSIDGFDHGWNAALLQAEVVTPPPQTHEAARSLPSSGFATSMLLLISATSTLLFSIRKKLSPLFSLT
jgi:hypothetical protein